MFLSSGQRWQRRLVIAWSLFAGVAVLWDLSWCFVFRELPGSAGAHDWRIVWTTYGNVDRRFLRGDGYLVVIEIITGFGALLDFYVVYQLLRGTAERARVALFAISIMEIYGALIYFGSEALDHFVDIDTSSFVRTWVLFVGLNSLWLIFPGWCLYEMMAPRVRTARAAPARRAAHWPRAPLGGPRSPQGG